ncbi:MAG: CBS domain-containing protein [Gammaproteobacteria bacterium]
MAEIVILGAGTGGTIVANLLARDLDTKEFNLTVIDNAERHLYQPGLLFIPFKLYGYHGEEDIARDIRAPLPKRAKFVKAEVTRIDHENRRVETSDGSHAYDWLVCSLGCRVAADEVEGLADALNREVFTFYTLDGAVALQGALEKFEGGHLVIDIADMPIKCPVAPIEFAFLADYYFEQKGMRDKVEISLVTPFSGAFTKPVANRVLSRIAEEKRVKVVPDFAIERVDTAQRTIHSFQGDSVHYDLLCIIPPNLGPSVLDSSGLGDASGYAFTDPRTLKSSKAERIYFLGDNSNVATSKAGSVAHFEAETVVENIMREIQGRKPLPTFDGHANCFIESGHHKALLLDFNYDVEPLEGTFPTPHMGPFALLHESYMNHVGKIAFKWVYWNLLLPGYLPHVPLLPAHMSFVGKRVDETPAARHAHEIKVDEVMSHEPICVEQGTALRDAVRLMLDHRVSSLPVVDVDGHLTGILSDGDLISVLDLKRDSPMRMVLDGVLHRQTHKKMGTIVDDVMTRDPIAIDKNATLEQAAEAMDKHQVRHLVVTHADGTVGGVIGRRDLLELFMRKS